MGGAIAVHVAVQKLLPSLAGLAVIDVVEGKEHNNILVLSNKLLIQTLLMKAQQYNWSTMSHQELTCKPTFCVLIPISGTAMEALSSMQSFLRGRPSSFQSLEQGIEWW